MTTNIKRKVRVFGKSNSLTPDQAMQLVQGFTLDGAEPNYHHPRESPLHGCPFEDIEHMRQCWEENRKRFLEQAEPFKRPWGWWEFDAPEPRRREPVLYGFGSAGWSYYPPETTGLYEPKPTEREESDREYLMRHRHLLTATELTLIKESEANAEAQGVQA